MNAPLTISDDLRRVIVAMYPDKEAVVDQAIEQGDGALLYSVVQSDVTVIKRIWYREEILEKLDEGPETFLRWGTEMSRSHAALILFNRLKQECPPVRDWRASM